MQVLAAAIAVVDEAPHTCPAGVTDPEAQAGFHPSESTISEERMFERRARVGAVAMKVEVWGLFGRVARVEP